MRILLIIFLFSPLKLSFSQCETLHFAELGFEPAYCRTASYQSGNGVVYAAAAGGTPDYTYEWLNLTNGQPTSNTTVGGVNPGEYQIKVTDDVGCVITAVVKVDSINPKADFEILAVDVDTSLAGFYSAEIVFKNTSNDLLNVIEPWPFYQPNYFWKHQSDSNWTAAYFDDNYSVEISNPGFHEVCLISTNKNGCADTLCQSISISPPVFDDDSVQVYYSSVTGEVSVELLLTNDAYFNLVDLNGGSSFQYVLQPGTNGFQLTAGIYAYQIIDAISSLLICSGTIGIY